MEKIYRVQMNNKGMPNFSTAVEVADRPQGEWIEVSTLREIFGDVQYAHRGNSEAEAVIADVWYEVKNVLKGADDE